MEPTYRIRHWDELFENSESRKVRSPRWVGMPNKHDGKGYRRLVSRSDGAELFGAWCLIVEVASKMPTRGTLADEDGPLTAEDLSVKTGIPTDTFERALQLLVDRPIGWMEILPSPETSGASPETSGDAGTISQSTKRLPGRSGNDPKPASGGRSKTVENDTKSIDVSSTKTLDLEQSASKSPETSGDAGAGMEGKGREGKSSSATLTRRTPPPVDSRDPWDDPVSDSANGKGENRPPPAAGPTAHQRVVTAFCAGWERRYGTAYPFAGKKDGEHVKRILINCHGDAAAAEAATLRYFADNDDFVVKDRHGLGMFMSQFRKYIVVPRAAVAGGRQFARVDQ